MRSPMSTPGSGAVPGLYPTGGPPESREPGELRSRFVSGFEILNVAERQQRPVVIEAPVVRLDDVADVISERDPLQDPAGEPAGALVENRDALRAGRPGAAVELVDLVTG